MQVTEARPKTRRIKEHLLNQVATGLLKHGDSLPTEIELARSLGVGRHSVRQALSELSDAGMVDRKKKRGTVVTLNRSPAETGEKRSGYALAIPEIRSGIYPSLVKGFGEGAMAAHEPSMVYEMGMDIHRQGDTILRLIQNNVAGVAMVPVLDPMPDYQVQSLHSHGIPLVFCHRRTARLHAPLIKWSWEEVGRLAGATLAELGHRRIAFVDSTRSIVGDGYVAGLRLELQQRNIPFSDENVLYGDRVMLDEDLRCLEEVAVRLLGQLRRPTGVLCADDLMSERLFLAATRAGLRVPDDLSIIGFGPTFREGPVRQGLAVVAVDEVEMGRQAARLLDEMRAGRRAFDDNEEIVLPLTVLQGESLGPPRVS